MKTFSAKPSDISRDWFIVDAKDKTLGRLASQIAYILRGKHKAIFTPHMIVGDHVIVINAKNVKLSGKKEDDKVYFSHSGYLGGLKSTTAKEIRSKNPIIIVEKAVKGMLPKNVLGRECFRHLKVYAEESHPHAAQKPLPLPSQRVAKA